MSIFSNIENFFKKFMPKASAVTTIALSTVQTFGPELEIAWSLIDPNSEAAAAPIINEVTGDLGTVAGLLAKGSTAGVAGALDGVKTNLSSLLAEGHIKDPASLQRATGIINAIVSEIEVIQQKVRAGS